VVSGFPTSDFMLAQPCDAKSSTSFMILFELSNEVGSLSTNEVRIKLLQGAGGFPRNDY